MSQTARPATEGSRRQVQGVWGGERPSANLPVREEAVSLLMWLSSPSMVFIEPPSISTAPLLCAHHPQSAQGTHTAPSDPPCTQPPNTRINLA